MNKGAFIVVILILSLFCLRFTVLAASYTNVTVSEANNMIDSNPSLVLLDVRAQSEYDSGHIRKAKLIPVSELGGRLNELDKSSEILVYCKSGARSATASQILVDNGFLHVYNMLGGVTAWTSAGYPVYVKYSSIQEAINNASEGSAIFVSSGIYYEHLVVNKTIVLVGEDSENTIVYGDGTQIVLKLAYHHANVTRFKIQNGTKGVYIFDNAYSCIINDCNIVNNDIGVFVEDSDSNLIKGNIIFNNSEIGIKVFSTCTCTPVWENTVKDNELVGNSIGFLVVNSQLGMIYHNNFIDNVFQAYGSGNTTWNQPDKWDNGYPSGGNYWNDYTGVDLLSGPGQDLIGSDLIGDTPYVINKDNKDNYPLMGLWTREGRGITVTSSTELTLTFENVTSAGITTVNVTKTGPNPPSGLKPAENYYDIKTTASYHHKIKIKITYNGSNMTQEEEEASRLMRWNETFQQWMDITTQIDTQNNLIFGETSYLSIFAFFKPVSVLHEIAVTKVEPSQTFIEQGFSMFINVTVQNQGNYLENFNLTVYYGSNVIETKPVSLAIGATQAVAFIWNTTGVPAGDYAISAHASPVPGETNTADNAKEDGVVNVILPKIKITAIIIHKTIVCQGYTIQINVTTLNEGDSPQTFNLATYYNATEIETKTVTQDGHSNLTTTFAWNTNGLTEYTNYTISAHADYNTLVDGTILLVHTGDVYPVDMKVRVDDILAVAMAFGKTYPEPGYNAILDINCDLKIRVDDLLAAALNFGWTKP